MERFYAPESFSPAELANVSGLSMVMQRDWRRRKYISDFEGRHAHFSLHEAVTIAVMKTLSDHGIGPLLSKRMSAVAAKSIIWFALDAQHGPQIVGSSAEARKYKIEYEKGLEEMEKITKLKIEELGSFFFTQFGDGYIITSKLDEELPKSNLSVVTVLNLEKIGVLFAEAVGRPLVRVYLGEKAREAKENAKI